MENNLLNPEETTNLPRPSYLDPTSPEKQYEELRQSLMNQVVDARKKLLASFNTEELGPGLGDAKGKDFIQVFLRVRPFQLEELRKQENQDCVTLGSERVITLQAPSTSSAYKNAQAHAQASFRPLFDFSFSHVFAPSTSQKVFFDSCVKDMALGFLGGQNGLLFSYGVTNSGKTYTIQGTESQPGVIPQALEVIYDTLRDYLSPDTLFKPHHHVDVLRLTEEQQAEELRAKKDIFKLAETDFQDDAGDAGGTEELTKSSSCASFGSTHSISAESDCTDMTQIRGESGDLLLDEKSKYLIFVSFVEIYQEQVFDLLEPVPVRKGKRQSLKLAEDKRGNIFVKGLRQICVCSANEAYKLLIFGQKNLSFAATKLNYNSSRSHCVYTIQLLKMSNSGENTFQVSRTSKLSFCDLAGSERTAKTHGQRIHETGSINKSLLTLGKCISRLRMNQFHKEKQQLIPFRDSKLTRVLQNFLTGRSTAKMIVNINQLSSCFDETLAVLKFSAIAKQVRMNATLSPEKAVQPPLSTAKLPKEAAERLTMEWASEAKRASVVPLPDDSGNATPMDAEGEMDKTLNENPELREYQELVETLRAQLIQEKRRNLKMEKEIREEVCNEFASHMQEMDDRYNDVRREEQQDAEDLAQERLELYVGSAQKKTERLRRVLEEEEEEDGDGEYVDVELLQAEKKKNETLEKEVLELKEKLKQKERSSGFVERSSRTSKMSVDSLEEAGGSSESELESLRKRLAEKELELKETNECLEEAGRTFVQHEERMTAMEATIAAEQAEKQALMRKIEVLQRKLEEAGSDHRRSTPTGISLGAPSQHFPITSPTHKRKSPTPTKVHLTSGTYKMVKSLHEEHNIENNFALGHDESNHGMWKAEGLKTTGNWESTRLEEKEGTDRMSMALSPITESDDGRMMMRPKVQLNDNTIEASGVIRVDVHRKQSEEETIRFRQPEVVKFRIRKEEAMVERAEEIVPETPPKEQESPKTPWRRRWDRIVKQNRATKLRIKASPSVKHNHDTGSLYHLEGEQAAQYNKQKAEAGAATLPRQKQPKSSHFANLFGTLGRKNKRRSSQRHVMSSKRRKSGAPRVVLGNRFNERKVTVETASSEQMLKQKIQTTETELVGTRRKMEELKQAEGEKNNEIERLQHEVHRLQENQGSQQDQGFKLIELESRIFELEGSLATAENENRKLRDAKMEELKKIEAELTAAKLAAESLKKELSESNDRRKDLEAKAEDCKKRREVTEKELAEIQKSLEKKDGELKKLEKDRTILMEAMREFDAEKAELVGKVTALESEKSRLQGGEEEKKKLEERIVGNEAEVKEERRKVEEALKELEHSKKQLEAAVAMTAETKKELSEERKKTEKFLEGEKKWKELETGLKSELKRAQDQVLSFEQRNKSQETALEESMQKLEAQSSKDYLASEALKNAQDEMKELERKLREADYESKELRETKNGLLKELHDSRKELVDVKKAKVEAVDSLRAAQAESDKLGKDLGMAETALESERKISADLKKENGELQRVIAQYKAGLKETEDVQQKFEQLVANRKGEIDSLHRELEDARGALSQKNTQLKVAEENVARMTRDLNIKNQIEIELRNTLSVAQQEKQRMHQTLTEIQANAAKVDRQRMALDANNTILSGQRHQLQQNLTVAQNELRAAKGHLEERDAQLRKVEQEMKDLGKKHAQELKQSQEHMKAWRAEKDKLVDEIKEKLSAKDAESQKNLLEVEELKTNFQAVITEKDDVIRQLEEAVGSGRKRETTGSVGDADEKMVVESVEVSPFEKQLAKPQPSATGSKKTASSRKKGARSTKSNVEDVGQSTKKAPRSAATSSTVSLPEPVEDQQDTSATSSKRKRKPKAPFSPGETKPSDFFWMDPDPPARKAKSSARDKILAAVLQSSPQTAAESASADAFDQVPPQSQKKKRPLFKAPAEKFQATPPNNDESDSSPVNAVTVVTKELKTKKKRK